MGLASEGADGADKKDEHQLDDLEVTQFEELDIGFQQVLQELVNDSSLDQFHGEYKKMHTAVKKSYESEKKLLKKCKALNGEIISNAVNVQAALKLSVEDEKTMGALKQEVDRAWSMVEQSQEKEAKAKTKIHKLKHEINNLTKLVERGASAAVQQERLLKELRQKKEDIVQQKDALTQQSSELTELNQETTKTVNVLETEKVEAAMEIQSLRDLAQSKADTAMRERRRVVKLNAEMAELEATLRDNKEAVLHEQDLKSGQLREQNGLVEQQLKEQVRVVEKLAVQGENLKEDYDHALTSYKKEVRLKEEETKKNQDIKAVLKQEQEVALKATKNEVEKLDRVVADLKRRKVVEDQNFQELLNQKNVIIGDLRNLVKDAERMQAFAEKDGTKIMELLYERDQINRGLIKTDISKKRQDEIVAELNQKVENTKEEVEKWKAQVSLAVKKVEELDSAREKAGMALSAQNKKYFDTLEDIKSHDNKLSELKKILQELREQMNQQKDQYETVRADRNKYSKQLVESQDEIAEMRRKFKLMFHQIEQLRGEVKEKEEAVKRETFEHDAKVKELDRQKEENERARKKQAQLRDLAEQENLEIKKLEYRIQEFEATRQNQKQQYEALVAERDVLGTQLIRRNDELALLYEKIKIQYETLEHGEQAFLELEDNIRNAKIVQKSLIRDCERNKSSLGEVGASKRKIYEVQRNLLRERTKVKALSEELENPTNQHRWRKLEGNDPSLFEMIQKVKTLQKRLIGKTEQSVEKDLILQERQKLYVELQQILANQMGVPEIAARVSAYQSYLKSCTRRMKSVAAELNMHHAQISDYKDEIVKTTQQVNDTQKRYFDQKRRQQLFRVTEGAAA